MFFLKIVIFTVFAGWHAEGTIQQTIQIHKDIEIHEAWAVTSTGFTLLFAALSFWYRKSWGIKYKAITLLFFVILFGLFSVTAWHGGELVYRDGAGVIAATNGQKHTAFRTS